jgi:enediyne biosynthesis protein E4
LNRRRFLLAQLAALPRFADVTAESKVDFQRQSSATSQKYLPEAMGGGVALFDYDGDGWLDLFLVNGARLEDPMPSGKTPDKSEPRFWNRLYRNNRDGTFTDVTAKAGVPGHSYGMGAAAGDYDNDGHADLFVSNLGRNILYRNNGNGTFTDVTARAGVAGGGWSAGACWVDFDGDGWLDLVVARYLDWDFSRNPWCGDRRPGYRAYCHPDQFKAVTHLLYRNNRDGTFTDVSRESGLGASPGKGLGVAINDYNRDGRPDILIANDSFPQQLFRNQGGGKFEEVGLAAGIGYDEDGKVFAGMGVDFADYDNDGWPDAFINALALQKYALFRNGKGSFDYVTGPSGIGGISALHSGWGAKFIDYDNDGWKDLFVAQGHVMDNIEVTQPALRYLEAPVLARNTGGRFNDVSKEGGAPFAKPLAARGAAFGDLNNDGLLEAVINCRDGRAVVLRNLGAGPSNWLLVNTIGGPSNRDGIGAKLRLVTASGLEQHAIVSTGGSYLSSSDKRVHFGLGPSERAALLEVAWPSGTVQRLENIRANQILTVREPPKP